MSDLEELDRYLVDSGVLIPPHLAGALLGVLRPLVTSAGRPLRRDLIDVLQALAVTDPAVSARGPAPMPPCIVDDEGSWISTSTAAQRAGCSASRGGRRR